MPSFNDNTFDKLWKAAGSWQQATPTQSENDPSNYGGIRKLETLQQSILALHLTAVGIYSELLATGQMNSEGALDVTHEVAAIFVSFAKLKTQVQDLHSVATVAERHFLATAKNTSESTKQL